ncbi:MAG: hypothetical protein PHS79_05310 [Patescibacteria group bacterium]|nr:hypothetical protein [Patescibacteria group bacterium]
MNRISAAIIRTLAFQAAWDYAPTGIELAMLLDVGPNIAADSVETQNLASNSKPNSLAASDIFDELNLLINTGELVENQGRLSLSSHIDQINCGRENEFYFPRKLRNARRVAKYLKRLPWVRAVCLCNTTALGQARDDSDLDFFVIVKSGSIWRTRFFAALPFKLLGARPLSSRAESPAYSDVVEGSLVEQSRELRDFSTALHIRSASVEMTRGKDPVCLSFFVADNFLDLSTLMLPDDDPYFRYWFLSMLPLCDDGVLHELWEANSTIRSRHPLAKEWIALGGHGTKLRIKNYELRTRDEEPRIKKGKSFLESFFEKIQRKSFPENIKAMANRDSRVVVSDNVLKFHVDDKREKYRQRYYDICKQYEIEP